MKKIRSVKQLKEVANGKSLANSEEEMESPAEAASEPATESKQYDEHELKHMADTVMQAHEHMADPNVMKQIQPHLDKKVKAVKSLDNLRAMAASKKPY